MHECKDYSKKASKFNVKQVEEKVRDNGYQATSFKTQPGAFDTPVKTSVKRRSDSGTASY